MFDIPYGHGKTEAFWASQSMVPGEPIFALVQDDSTDDKNTVCLTTVSLDWVKDQMDQTWNASDGPGLNALEVFVILPGQRSLRPCYVILADKPNREDGQKLLVMTGTDIAWSCDL